MTDVNRDVRHDDILTDHVAGRRDIGDRHDIAEMITDFYTRAFADDLLGPVFVDVAELDLAANLPIMCDFWETVLFRAGLYRRNALQVHVDLHRQAHLTGAHFTRWLQLWHATIDERHAGAKADLAKTQAARIARSMQRRLLGERGSDFVTIQTRADDA